MMMKLIRLFAFAALLSSTNFYGQLADFNLQVSKTDETCPGNGSLTFSVTNLTPQSTLLYKVYKMPNVTTPVSIMATGNQLASLTAGTYRVIALQAVGSQSNSKQQDVTINQNIVPFNFSVSSPNQNCGGGGTLVVSATSGIAALYEIISGPITRPLQSSNTFTGLVSGTYNIRAFDVCGLGKVKTFTLTMVNTTLAISGATLTNMAVCDSISVSNTITASGGSIGYPLAVKHTLNPMSMSGESIIINQVFNNGPADAIDVTAVMPRYLTQSYTYDLQVIDNCSTAYQKNDIDVIPDIELSLTTGEGDCGTKYIMVSPSMHSAPYTIEFLSTPVDFNALAFNPNQGPYSDAGVNFGNSENTVPFGIYVVKVTDACGRTATETLDVKFVPPVPSLRGNNNGCFAVIGRIRASVPGSKLLTAVIIAAPAAYTQNNVLPKDVTSIITAAGALTLNNVPIGTYTLILTDDCGNTYEKEVEVPPFVEKPFNIATLPDCSAGFGTLRFRSGNGALTAASVVAAPSAYGHTLPYTVTSLISGGELYLNNLPQGTYTISGTDKCGIVAQLTINVEGYNPPQNSFTYTPNCGSFSVKMADTSNGLEGASYWLQKFNPATGTWGHPSTGAVYADGALPTAATGIKLSNNATRNNLNYAGKFRLIKKFEAFNSGTDENTICVSILGEFTYTDVLSVSNAYSLACVGEPNTVYIEALGYPTSYRIVEKNGTPFFIQNGSSNVFHNLAPANYKFEVEDACGNIIPKSFSLQALPSITEASQPKDMVVCSDGAISSSNDYQLSSQNAAVLGSLPAAFYTITYHASQADADSGQNVLPDTYTTSVNGKVIYARLVHNEISLCHGVVSFKLLKSVAPVVKITTEGLICDGGKITLTANSGFAEYLWSTGETTRSILVENSGDYTVFVKNQFGCEDFDEVTVKASVTPKIVDVETTDWTWDENTITIHTDNAGDYLYSIDGYTFQESNIFTNLKTGLYTVSVKDAEGCGIVTKEVPLLYYPNFFTPNGDGTHDKWQIKYSILEPHMKISIFDRYGKLIINFGSTSDGWDGNLNGHALPSSDYWFVVTREDGREFKGHFSMVR